MRLGVIFALVTIINMVDTLAFGARIAGVKTKSPTVAMSLYNLLALFSRTANLIQLPLLATIVDRAIASGGSEPILPVFRLVLLAASFGTLLGIFLIPSSIQLFVKGINALEVYGSVPSVLIQVSHPGTLRKIEKSFRLPSRGHLQFFRLGDVPASFLVSNLVLTSIYAVGVLAAIYAGFLVPEYRLTASNLSGIINGSATILLVLLVDPVSAVILDQTLQGKRQEDDLKGAIAFLAGGRLAGTLLAQLLLVPASQLIVVITKLIS